MSRYISDNLRALPNFVRTDLANNANQELKNVREHWLKTSRIRNVKKK